MPRAAASRTGGSSSATTGAARGGLEETAGGRGTVAFVQRRRAALGAAPLPARRHGRETAAATATSGRAPTAPAPSASGACCSELRAAALPVPVPVAARYVRDGLFYRADLVTEELPTRLTLARALEQGPLGADAWRAIGACIGRLHARGVHHADLNAHNLLLGPDGAVYVLDFDRGRIRARGAWEQAVLERLQRSLRKVTAEPAAGPLRRRGVAVAAARPRGRLMRLLYVLLTYLLAPLVFAMEAWKSLWNPEYRGRLGQRLGLRRAATAGREPVGARRVGGRGAGRGRAGPGVAQAASGDPGGGDDGDADRRAARPHTVRRHRAALLPAVRPAGCRAPVPRPRPAARRDHPRDGDLADAVQLARPARHPAGHGERARLDALGRPLPAHGVAVPRDAVARHPDRRADPGRCRAVPRHRRARRIACASPAT